MENKILLVILGILVILVIIYIASKPSSKASDGYQKLTFQEMKKMIDEEKIENYVILDVRTLAEHNESNIPESILIPDYEIYNAEKIIKDKEKVIFVYCRSGNRSKKAVYKLIEMGYVNVYDVGGIIDYPYELSH